MNVTIICPLNIHNSSNPHSHSSEENNTRNRSVNCKSVNRTIQYSMSTFIVCNYLLKCRLLCKIFVSRFCKYCNLDGI